MKLHELRPPAGRAGKPSGWAAASARASARRRAGARRARAPARAAARARVSRAARRRCSGVCPSGASPTRPSSAVRHRQRGEAEPLRRRHGGDAGTAAGDARCAGREGGHQGLGNGEITRPLTVRVHAFSRAGRGEDSGRRRKHRGDLGAGSAEETRCASRTFAGKLLYTMGLLVVFRIGSFVPVPGVDAAGLAAQLGVEGGGHFRVSESVLRAAPWGALRCSLMGVQPVHHRVHYPAAVDDCHPKLEELAKEGPEGRQEDSAVHPLRHRGLGIIQSIGVTSLAYNWGVLARHRRVHVHHHRADADGRLHVPDVAGREDYRARHRQRHLAADFRGYRGRRARGHRQHFPGPGRGRRQPVQPAVLRGGRSAGHYGHHHGAAGRAAGAGAVRQAGGGPAHVRRSVHPHPDEGEPGRRHPGHLRVVGADVPADAGAVHPGHRAVGGTRDRDSAPLGTIYCTS